MAKNHINGWLCIDKPEGITSTGVVNQVKHILRPVKIGHAGTLDPFASGMLLLALGEATKTVQFAMNNLKAYSFTIRFGEERDTLDIDGKIVGTSNTIPGKNEVLNVINDFIGEHEQIPPRFSAIKIGGQRAYNLARSNCEFQISSRKVTLYKIELLFMRDNVAGFYIECGKGFYVRSLARDLCKKIGVIGYVESLRRLRSGKFIESDMILLDSLEKVVHNDRAKLQDFIYPVNAVLDDILVRQISEEEATILKKGRSIIIDLAPVAKENQLVAACLKDKLVAVCEIKDNGLAPKRVFNLF